jgi:C-terminal processing protease CtpA/Prc
MIRKIHAYLVIAIIVGTVAAAAFVGGWTFSRELDRQSLSGIRFDPNRTAQDRTPPEAQGDFAVFWEVWELVHHEFYRPEPLNQRQMVYGAIRGMLHSLGDEYTSFEEPKIARKTRESIQGSFEGVGVIVGIQEGEAVVAGALQGSPAFEAGLQSGDIILEVNGTPVAAVIQGLGADEALSEVTSMIRGPRESIVHLILRRPPGSASASPSASETEAEAEPFEVALKRTFTTTATVKVVRETEPPTDTDPLAAKATPEAEVIAGVAGEDAEGEGTGTTEPGNQPVEILTTTLEANVELARDATPLVNITMRMLNDEIAYLQIIDFNNKTPEELDKAIVALRDHSPAALVLDLRGNRGGVIESSQGVLGRFYEGTALYEANNRGDYREYPTIASPDHLMMPDLPMVVLIDEYTASAAEIVAGALRERRPDTILVGRRTFGKGSVQNIHWLPDGSSVRITVAHLFTPGKNEIHDRGIAPDHPVAAPPDPPNPDDAMPCVGGRQPAEGQNDCIDAPLSVGVRLLTVQLLSGQAES